ncbi:MAG: HNH endonuclease [bacterium]|nr:HNH endonuclease [bacterium]
MPAFTLPVYEAGQSAARVDEALHQALAVGDRAHECAVLWFAEVQRRGLFRELGYASRHLYATQALGFSDNRAWQFKRLADDLDRLPLLREAVTVGELGWTKAQQVARVATAETQAAWVAQAKTQGRRELEREVQAARKRARVGASAAASAQMTFGDDPALAPAQVPAMVSAPDPGFAPLQATEASTYQVTLRLDAVQLARFEALLEAARKARVAPATADRAELVLAGLAALVEGAGVGGGEPAMMAVDDAEAASAAPALPAKESPGRNVARRATRHMATQIVVHQCPTCEAAAAVTARGELPLAPAQVAALTCDARVRERGRPNRATIPPALRAAVLVRDRHRCASPGCGATRFLEVHHITPRQAGGANTADNLVTLCSRCHAFAHARGALAPAQVRAQVPVEQVAVEQVPAEQVPAAQVPVKETAMALAAAV